MVSATIPIPSCIKLAINLHYSKELTCIQNAFGRFPIYFGIFKCFCHNSDTEIRSLTIEL